MTNPESAVTAEVESLAPRLVASVAEAIRLPSVNPRYPGQDYDAVVGPESDVGALLADLYREAGADVRTVTVERGRDNVVGLLPASGSGRSLLFNGHVDVVPGGREDRWDSPPFRPRTTDDEVTGRGSTDMKGGLIAAAYAAIALRRAGVTLDGSLQLQAVVGEEVGDHAVGTSAVLDAGYTAERAVICEPTGLAGTPPAVVPTTPGLLWFSVSMEGKAAHSGLRGLTIHPTLEGAALGVNIIDKFWVIYRALRRLEDDWAERDRHPLFRPGSFGILPGVLQANPAGVYVPFFLADTLTAEYCVYHHPDRSSAEVIDEIERCVRAANASDRWLAEHPVSITWKLVWAPYSAPAGDAFVAAALAAHVTAGGSAATPPALSGFFGVCDITWMAARGVQGVVYGPGVGTTAHAENERVEIAQLVHAAKTYALLAMRWCGTGHPVRPET